MTEHAAIESVLNEDRVFPPPPEFSANANVKSFEEYERIYDEAAKDVPAFWAKQAEDLNWFKKWDTVLEWNEPFAKWFVGGKLNIAYNCLDRHLDTSFNSIHYCRNSHTVSAIIRLRFILLL